MMRRKLEKRQARFKIIKYIGIAGIGLVLILVSIHQYMVNKYKDNLRTLDQAKEMQVDCILVLGAGIWPGDKPSHILRDRLERGILLYQQGTSNRLLMSGDHGREGYDEVNVMKNYAIQKGIEADTIFMDHAGFSTYESMVRAKEIFQVEKMIIVTQAYHMPRALYVANELGIEAFGVSAKPVAYIGQRGRELREVVARIKDVFYVLTNQAPTYLGDVIPIGGSGTLTDD